MIGLLICFIFIALVDLVPLIQSKSWKDIIGFGILFAGAMAISILDRLGMPPPSITLALDSLLKMLHLSY